MKNKLKKLFLIILYSIFAINIISSKSNNVFADSTTITATFKNKSWETNENIVFNGTDVDNYIDGVQITTTKSGTSITSESSYDDISKVVVHYHSNASKGAGSIDLKIGNGSSKSQTITKDGGVTSRYVTFDINPLETGKINFIFNCTTNSVYIEKIEITYAKSTPLTPPVDPNDVEEDDPSLEGKIKIDRPASTYNGSYYNSVDTTKKGNALLLDIYNAIKVSDTKRVGYDRLKQAYVYTDNYGGYIYDMYSNAYKDTSLSTRNLYKVGSNFCSNNGGPEGTNGYNREHTIPQSWFDNKEPMLSDMFHVYPTDGYVNKERSNYPHGDVKNATFTSKNGSKLGSCDNKYYSGTVFEVIDEYKGDFARSYLYMAVRYCDRLNEWGSGAEVVFKDAFPYLTDFAISTYIKWSIEDPVSQKEIDRNNAVYTQTAQGNRNPFIDNPSWVLDIWQYQEASPYAIKGTEGTNPDPITPTPTIDEDQIKNNVKDIKTLSQLKVNYDVLNNAASINSASIKYIFNLDNSILTEVKKVDSNASAGIIIMSSFIKDISTFDSIEDLQKEDNYVGIVTTYSQESNNNTIFNKYVYENFLSEDDTNIKYTAIGFVRYGNKVIFATKTTYSLFSLASSLKLKVSDKKSKEYLALSAITNKNWSD